MNDRLHINKILTIVQVRFCSVDISIRDISFGEYGRRLIENIENEF